MLSLLGSITQSKGAGRLENQNEIWKIIGAKRSTDVHSKTFVDDSVPVGDNLVAIRIFGRLDAESPYKAGSIHGQSVTK